MQGSLKHALRDIYILCICVLATIFLVKTGALDLLLQKIKDFSIVGSFVAGIFFTSVFTITASAVILVEIAKHTDPLIVALFGAFGALIGDLALFTLVKDKVTKNVDVLIQKASHGHPVAIFHLEFLKWLNPILGAIVIASPLPDELGLALLGFSKLKPSTLVIILFVMNGIGIYLIANIAQITSLAS